MVSKHLSCCKVPNDCGYHAVVAVCKAAAPRQVVIPDHLSILIHLKTHILMYMYMYLYVYVYVYICICICIYIYMYMYMYMYLYNIH